MWTTLFGSSSILQHEQLVRNIAKTNQNAQKKFTTSSCCERGLTIWTRNYNLKGASNVFLLHSTCLCVWRRIRNSPRVLPLPTTPRFPLDQGASCRGVFYTFNRERGNYGLWVRGPHNENVTSGDLRRQVSDSATSTVSEKRFFKTRFWVFLCSFFFFFFLFNLNWSVFGKTVWV